MQKTFERFPWKGIEVAHVLKVPILHKILIHQLFKNLKSQRELDLQLGCSWQVVVGEVYSFSVDYEQVKFSTIWPSSDHRNLGKPPHTKTAAFTLYNNGTASLLRAQCPMSSMAPLLSFSGNADSNFSKRQSKENVQLLRRRWYQIVKLLNMHILHFPGTCQYQIWRKETGKHRKIWTDLVGQKEICTCNLDYFSFVMLPMPSNLGIFPLLFLTLSVIRWFAMI